MSILVVEQFARIVLGVADLAVVMVQGTDHRGGPARARSKPSCRRPTWERTHERARHLVAARRGRSGPRRTAVEQFLGRRLRAAGPEPDGTTRAPAVLGRDRARVAGLVVIGLGWWGASGTKYVYQEIPYVISGGIFGVALVLLGAALFARYSVARLLRFWLARLVADQQIQTDRVVDAIDVLVEEVAARPVSTDDASRPTSG